MTRRAFLVAGAAAGATPLLLRGTGALALPAGDPDGPQGRAFGFPAADMTSKITRDITFPVDGKVSWSDTYGACRDGCSRRHEGQDLLGTKLQRLVACVTGEVVGFKYASDGNYLYLRDGDGYHYGYLHINNDTPGTDDGKNPANWAFAPGIAMGAKVRRGQLIAYLGDSGNAESTAPHCHFEIRKPAKSVWDSQAINARYSLEAATPAPPQVPPATFKPWTTSGAFIRQQYADFLGRAPDSGALEYYAGVLDTGERAPAWLIAVLIGSSTYQDTAGTVYRLYRSYFRRNPDHAGFQYWVKELRRGVKPTRVSEQFTSSTEFARDYGRATSNAAFVDTVYRNVLRRTPDAAGKAYWTSQLDQKAVTKGAMMLSFSDSAENRTRLAAETAVFGAYSMMLRRTPSASAFDGWTRNIRTGESSTQRFCDYLRASGEYTSRFS